MGDEWDMASDCENDAVEEACELANEEFNENYERYFEEECRALQMQQQSNDEDDFGEDDGITNGGDWDSDFGGEGSSGDFNSFGLIEMLDFALDILDALLSSSDLANISSAPSIHIPTPRITEETWLTLDLYYMFLGDNPTTRAFQRAIDDIPLIKAQAFSVFLEELEYQLNDEFAGYPEAYIATIYADRGNDGLRTINSWDPNLGWTLPTINTF